MARIYTEHAAWGYDNGLIGLSGCFVMLTTDEADLTDSFFLVGAPLARLVQLRQLHPLEGTQNPFNPLNLLLILRTLTICVIP